MLTYQLELLNTSRASPSDWVVPPPGSKRVKLKEWPESASTDHSPWIHLLSDEPVQVVSPKHSDAPAVEITS
jgi:hypothetical protein